MFLTSPLQRIRAAALFLTLAISIPSLAGPMGPVRPQMIRTGTSLSSPSFDVTGIVDWAERDMDRSQVRTWRSLVRGTLSVSDNMLISLYAGPSNVNPKSITGFNPTMEIHGDIGITAGIGGGMILAETELGTVALNANYLKSFNHDGDMNPGGPVNNKYDYSEVNAGVQLQGNFYHFTPYLGVRYSEAWLDYDRIAAVMVTRQERSDQNIGVYLGVGWDASEDWAGHMEVRAIDEFGVGAGLTHRF